MSSPSLSGKHPAGYVRHSLHTGPRTYLETNCFTDVVVELLHACDYEPLAMMAHVLRMDFEGDQWTFFKPPTEDLEALFGVDLHEMQPYRSLELQIGEQLTLGRTMIIEFDSFHLPDLVATSYRSEHVKTSVAIDWIDPERELIHYFHGPGMFALQGEDYRGILRLGPQAADVLPPYAELVRFDAGPKLAGSELRAAALTSLRRNLAHRPSGNPAQRFATALAEHLPTLLAGDLQLYHDYAFATVRIAGSGFEALQSYVQWLFGDDGGPAVAALAEFVGACKALSFRLARRREFDPSGQLATMIRSWEQAITALLALSA